MNVDDILKSANRVKELRQELAAEEARLMRLTGASKLDGLGAAPARPPIPRSLPVGRRQRPSRSQTGQRHPTGDDRLPYGTADRVLAFMKTQEKPVKGYHVAKELGIDPKWEPRITAALHRLVSQQKIVRVAEGTFARKQSTQETPAAPEKPSLDLSGLKAKGWVKEHGTRQ